MPSAAVPQVAVIGGGAVGCCTALACADAGLQAVLVEPRARLGGGASWAAGGILGSLSPWDEPPQTLELARDALQRWRELERRAQDQGAAGMELDLGLVYAGLSVRQREFLQDSGLPLRPLEASPLRERLLQLGVELDAGNVAGSSSGAGRPEKTGNAGAAGSAGGLDGPGGALLADVGVLRPPAALRSLAVLLEAHPGVEVWRSQVLELEENGAGGRAKGGGEAVTLHTDRGRRSFAAAVLTAGSRSPLLLPQVRVEPVIGQMAAWNTGVPGPGWVLCKGHHYAIQRRDGLVLVGATLESRGQTATVTAQGEEQMREAAARLCPALTARRPDWVWAGTRPGAPRPLVGPLEGHRRLWANTGHHRLGICCAPASAHRIAEEMVLCLA